jgi:hypothetical protein
MPNQKVSELGQIYSPLSNDLLFVVRSGVGYKATPNVVSPILFTSGTGISYMNSRQIPTASTSAGVSGQFTFKDNFLYVHNGTGWLRTQLLPF